MKQVDERIGQMIAGGTDAGGESVNAQIKLLAEFQHIIQEFSRREIQIKDVERGLIDFPALLGGREIFLCWELEDDDIEFWHELDAGYAVYDAVPLDQPDEWGDLASFRDAAAAS